MQTDSYFYYTAYTATNAQFTQFWEMKMYARGQFSRSRAFSILSGSTKQRKTIWKQFLHENVYCFIRLYIRRGVIMANQNVTTHTSRDSWKSKWGFVLACIGSAVGMGNIWLFPSRVAKYGGAFLLAYFIFDILIGFSGVIGEMSFGRATRSGPVGSFEKACAPRGKSSLGMKIGLLPMAGALALAILCCRELDFQIYLWGFDRLCTFLWF